VLAPARSLAYDGGLLEQRLTSGEVNISSSSVLIFSGSSVLIFSGSSVLIFSGSSVLIFSGNTMLMSDRLGIADRSPDIEALLRLQ